MVRVIEIVQLGVLTVDGQCVLGQIIGSQGKEIHFLRQLVGHHDRSGGFHHNADFHPTHGHALGFQFGLAFLQNFLGVPNLPDGNYHGKHNGHSAEGTGPEDGPKLGPEDSLPGQADTDSPVGTFCSCSRWMTFKVLLIFPEWLMTIAN